MYANRPVDTARLVDALWPRRAPRTAPVALRTYVSALRQVLMLAKGTELPCLATVPGGYQLHCAPTDLDLLAFEDLAAQGRQAVVGGHPAQAAERLRRALGLWRGRPFEDVPLDSEFSAELARLDEHRLSAHEALFGTQLALGHHQDVLPELQALVAAQPLRELLWSQWMLALYRSGRRAEALRAYGDLRRHLVRELGVEPAPPLQTLHRQILASDPALAPPPSVRTSGPPVPRQLPADIGTFTGREAELAAIETLASSTDPPRALVISAIDGMAGVGKTALAVHTANRLADRYPDGQLFVDLHGFTHGVPPVDLGDALERMLRCLGVPGEQIPVDLDSRAALYRTHLAGKRALIVLDNAATEAQVRPLLPGTGGCLVLITSRARLAGLAEAEPLSLDVLPPDDAVALFVRAAGPAVANQPRPVLDEIVRLCGHLPLAIRVAAARMRSRPHWTAAHLAERLRDHQHRLSELAIGGLSVTTAIDLSYQHLPADGQRMYRLLGLHPGPGFDVHAAAVLAGTSVRDAERLLDTLVDMHLVQEPLPGRYRFHDLLRAHACGITDASPTAAVTRLFDHYAHLAGVATDLLYPYRADRVPHIQHPTGVPQTMPDKTSATAWLDVELTNLLAVATHGSPRHALCLSESLHSHLLTRASFDHAITLHRNALRLARSTADRAGEVIALGGLGTVYLLQMRYPHAVQQFEKALHIAKEIGHADGQCTALNGLACVHRAHGRIGLATELFEETLRIARDTGHLTAQLEALRGLGHVHRHMRRHREATRCLEEALEIARRTGNLDGELNALWALGHVHWLEHRRQEAAACHTRALEIARSTGNRVGELRALTGLGHDSLIRGRYDAATGYFSQIGAIAAEIGDPNSEFESLYGLGQVHRATGRPHQAATLHETALTIARNLGQPTDEARALTGLAHAHRDLGHPDQARHHWQHALKILTDLGVHDAEEVSAEQIHAHLSALPTPAPQT
ncbi:BTAD domain-containing putative transcriptional regulator [Actinocrispum sp. NPDC049592]|uniref:AfsR/SARP family transcriptional regulator n=1 Tax=Actinocrispum sp. NPDC049592 TaxID=3154835 RepID=UPI00343FEE30